LLAATADRLRTGDLGKIRLYYKIAKEPLASSLLAEDVIEKVDAHSFFMGAPDHVTIRRQVASGRKQVSFVPVHFRSGRRNSDRVFARALPGCARPFFTRWDARTSVGDVNVTGLRPRNGVAVCDRCDTI
jgi:hypothetical protein